MAGSRSPRRRTCRARGRRAILIRYDVGSRSGRWRRLPSGGNGRSLTPASAGTRGAPTPITTQEQIMTRALTLACCLAIGLLVAMHSYRTPPRQAAVSRPLHSAPQAHRHQRLSTRTWRGVSVTVPSSWRAAGHDRRSGSWVDPEGLHAVTLGAAVAAGSSVRAPLQSVTADVRQRGGTAVSSRIDARGMRAEISWTIPGAGGADSVWVRQTWTRVSGVDLIATWTSRDRHWPVDPTQGHPNVGA